MIPRLSLLIVLGLLAGPVPARAACNWFGTQLDCAFGDRHVVLGTQAADDPTHAGSAFRPHLLHGHDRILDDRPAPTPFRIELQDIGADPRLCRRIGNETYCY